MSKYAVTGETIEKVITLSTDEITAFATQIEDMNPLHHDAKFAEQTRFKSIIASGPQVLSIFMAMLPTYFAQKAYVLGLDFSNDFSYF